MSSSLPPIMTLNNKATNHSSCITFMCGSSDGLLSSANCDQNGSTTHGTKPQRRQEHHYFRRANTNFFTNVSSPPSSPIKQSAVKPPPALAFQLNKDTSLLPNHLTGSFGREQPTPPPSITSSTPPYSFSPTEQPSVNISHGFHSRIHSSHHGQQQQQLHLQQQKYSSNRRRPLWIPISSNSGLVVVIVVVALTCLTTFTMIRSSSSMVSPWMIEGEDYYNYQNKAMMYPTTMDHSHTYYEMALHGQLLRNERDLIERQHEQEPVDVDSSLSSLAGTTGNNGDQMVTFSFDDCVGVSVPTCQTIVKNQLIKDKIWKNVRIQFNVLESPSSDHVFGTEPQDVYIQVNSLGQVLSGGKTSKLGKEDTDPAIPNGFVGFDIELPDEIHHHGQPCYMKSYDHCCRNIQRSYQRFIRIEEVNHDRHEYQRIEEEIDTTDVTVWDSHCMLEPILPKTTVYVSNTSTEGVVLEEVVLEEYIYNESTQKFDLLQNTINPSSEKVVITLNVQTAATIGYHSVLGVVVSQAPTWMVHMVEVEPKDVLENRNDPFLLEVASQEEPSSSKAIDYYLSQHDAVTNKQQHEHRSGMLGEMEMLERNIAPPSTTTAVGSASTSSTTPTGSSIWLAMSESWRYSLPMAIAIATLCACCGFLMFMCCIPVSSLEEHDDHDSNDSSSAVVAGKLGNTAHSRNKKRHQSNEKATSSTTLEDEYDDEDEYYHDNINGGCYPDEDLCHSDDDTEVAHHPGKDYLRHSLVGKHHYYGSRHRL